MRDLLGQLRLSDPHTAAWTFAGYVAPALLLLTLGACASRTVGS